MFNKNRNRNEFKTFKNKNIFKGLHGRSSLNTKKSMCIDMIMYFCICLRKGNDMGRIAMDIQCFKILNMYFIFILLLQEASGDKEF